MSNKVVIDVNVCPSLLDADVFFERAAFIEFDHLIPTTIRNFDYMHPRSKYPTLIAIREEAYRMAENQLTVSLEETHKQERLYIDKLLNSKGGF